MWILLCFVRRNLVGVKEGVTFNLLCQAALDEMNSSMVFEWAIWILINEAFI